jgi:hypothetical protein
VKIKAFLPGVYFMCNRDKKAVLQKRMKKCLFENWKKHISSIVKTFWDIVRGTAPKLKFKVKESAFMMDGIRCHRSPARVAQRRSGRVQRPLFRCP